MAEDKLANDPFEMFRRLWGPLGLPVPGMAMPTLDPQEVERRIADLRSIEGWLSMNLGMVRMSIQGLEMQKAALLAVGAARAEGAPKAQEPAAGPAAAAAQATNAMLWPWAFMQQAIAGAAGAAPPAGGERPAEAGAGEPSAAPPGEAAPAPREPAARKPV